jgi:hypothetical protein
MRVNDIEQKSSPTSRNRHRVRRWAALLAALVGLGIGLVACGGGSPKSSTDSPNSSGSSGSSQTQLMTDALKYSDCMRSHGLADFPDPTKGSNGMPSWNINASGNSDLNPQSSQYQAAQQACKDDLPDLAPTTPSAKAAANAKALKYAACMRSHGEPDFPDPNGQGLIQITNATGILAPNSPQDQSAQQACQSLDNGFEMQATSDSSSKAPGRSGS